MACVRSFLSFLLVAVTTDTSRTYYVKFDLRVHRMRTRIYKLYLQVSSYECGDNAYLKFRFYLTNTTHAVVVL
jgi:hypothetical protein